MTVVEKKLENRNKGEMKFEERDGQGEGHGEEEGQVSCDSASHAGRFEAFGSSPPPCLTSFSSGPTVPLSTRSQDPEFYLTVLNLSPHHHINKCIPEHPS